MLKKLVIVACITSIMSCAKPMSESETLDKASQAIAQNDYANAQVYLKNYLADFPEANTVRSSLAMTYRQQGNYIEAISQFERIDISSLTPTQIEGLLESYYFTGSTALALDKANRLRPEQISDLSLLFIATNKLRMNQDPTSLDQLLASTNTNSAIQEIATAMREFFDNKDTELFVKTVETVMQDTEFANNWFISSLLANTNTAIKDFDKAADYFSVLVELRPQYLEPKLFLADALLKSVQLEAAAVQAQEILTVFPKQPVANQVMAMVALEKQDWLSAKDYFETSIVAGYTSRANYLLAGAVNYTLGNYEQAITHLERGLLGMRNRTIYVDMLFQAKAFSRDPDSSIQELSNGEFVQFTDLESIKNVANALDSAGDRSSISTLFDRIDENQLLQGFEYDLFKARYISLNESSLSNLEQALSNTSSSSTIPAAQSMQAKLLVLRKFYLKQEFDEAIKLAAKWIEQSPEDTPSLLLYADTLQMAGQHQQAYELLSPLVANTDNPYVYMLQTWSLFELGKLEEALESSKGALALRKYDLILLRQYAYLRTLLEVQNQPDNWIKTIYSQPTLIESQSVLLSMYYEMIGDSEAALSTLQSIENAGGRSVVYHYTLAETYLKAGNKSEALKSALNASRETVIPYPAINDLFITLIKLDATDEALKMLNRQLVNYPTADELLIIVGELLVQKGNLDEAFTHLNRVKGNKTKSLSMQSDILLRQGKLKLGIDKLKQAYEHQSDFATGLKLATSYLQLGDVNLANRLINTLIKEQPNSVDVKILRAAVVPNKEAIEIYEDIIAQAPDNSIALNNLAWILFETGAAQQGLPYVEQTVKLAPQNSDFADTLKQIQQAL